jgi:hypothetical protein
LQFNLKAYTTRNGSGYITWRLEHHRKGGKSNVDAASKSKPRGKGKVKVKAAAKAKDKTTTNHGRGAARSSASDDEALCIASVQSCV